MCDMPGVEVAVMNVLRVMPKVGHILSAALCNAIGEYQSAPDEALGPESNDEFTALLRSSDIREKDVDSFLDWMWVRCGGSRSS